MIQSEDLNTILGVLKESRGFKVKNNWTRDIGSGFVKEQIQEVNLLKTLLVVKLNDYTIKVELKDLNDVHLGINLNETDELISWVEDQL